MRGAEFIKSSTEVDFQRALREGKPIYSGQLSMMDIDFASRVKRDFGDGEYIQSTGSRFLADKPFDFAAYDTPDSRIFLAVYRPEAELFNKNFFGALKTAIPSGAQSEHEATILSHWDIMFEEGRKRRAQNPAVFSSHSRHLEAFREFGEFHFQKFWDSSHAKTEQIQFMELSGHPKKVRSVEWVLNPTQQDQRVLRKYDLHYAGPKYELDVIYQLYNHNGNRRNNVDSLWDKMASVLKNRGFFEAGPPYLSLNIIFDDFNQDQTIALFGEFVESLSQNEKRQFAQMISWENNENGTHSEFIAYGDADSVGTTYDSLWNQNRAGYQLTKTDDNLLTWSNGTNSRRLKVGPVQENGERNLTSIEETFEPQPAAAIIPAFAWGVDKKTGNRVFYCGDITEELKNVIPGLSDQHDFLMGQVVVLGYSEALKKELPHSLSMVPGGPLMEIAESQLPATCDFYSPVILRESQVIRRLESLVENQTQQVLGF